MSRFHIREATQTETNTLIKITCSTKTPTEHIIIVQQSLIFQNPEAWGKRVHVKAREERNGHDQATGTWDLWRFYRSSKARTKTQNVPLKFCFFVVLENQIFQNRPSKTIDVRPISFQWKKNYPIQLIKLFVRTYDFPAFPGQLWKWLFLQLLSFSSFPCLKGPCTMKRV